ncbi:hypothetical protein ACQ4PT_071491 [Festuca glaucescens]
MHGGMRVASPIRAAHSAQVTGPPGTPGQSRVEVAGPGRSPAAAASREEGALELEGFPPLRSRPVAGPFLGPAQVAVLGATRSALGLGQTQAVGPSATRSGSAWLWLPKGSTRLALGFPASFRDIRCHRRLAARVCIPCSSFVSPARSFAQAVAMSAPGGQGGGGQGGGGHGGAAGHRGGNRQAGNKRRHEDRQGPGAGSGANAGGGSGRAAQSQEAALRAKALAEHDRHRQGTGGSRASGIQGSNAQGNNAPPTWWVEREKKSEAARLAQAAVAAAQAPPSAPAAAHGGGRAAEVAAGKQPADHARSSGQRTAVGVTDAAGTASSNMECFKCGRMGHFQAACTFPPVCLLCGVEGHNLAACTSKGRQPELRIMGQAVEGESFFALDFEEDDEEEEEMSNGAVISFKHVVLSARDLNRELHHLVEADWDWQVEETGAHEFSFMFPSRESLQISARSGRLFLPLSGTVVDIRSADSDPAPVEMLQEVWVRLTGVPRRMRRADRLLAGMRMLGWPKLGYSIGVHVEDEVGAPHSAPPPPPPHAGPEDDDDDNDVDDLSPSRKEWDELGERDKARAAASTAASVEGSATHLAAVLPDLASLGGFAATLPVVEDQYGSNLKSWPLPLHQLEQACAATQHPGAGVGCEPVGAGPVAAASPPLLDSSALLTAESDGEDSVDSPSLYGGLTLLETEDGGDEEMLEAEGQVVDQDALATGREAGVPRRRRTKTVPAEPARKSARLTGTASATPVLQRAQERTAAKNLDIGTIKDFSVLPNLPDLHLVTVTHDCGMAFEREQHTVSETLSLIRAKEEA